MNTILGDLLEFFAQIFLQKVTQYLVTSWAILIKHLIEVKPDVVTFGSTLEKLGYFYFNI